MINHNICFCWEIRKISAFFGWKKHLICCYVCNTHEWHHAKRNMCKQRSIQICTVTLGSFLSDDIFLCEQHLGLCDIRMPWRYFLSGLAFRYLPINKYSDAITPCWPRWLSWMCSWLEIRTLRVPPCRVGNIHGDLIMKYFLWPFSPFRWYKKDTCQFLAKECAQYWLTA